MASCSCKFGVGLKADFFKKNTFKVFWWVFWGVFFAISLSCGGGKQNKIVRLYNWTYFIPDETLKDFENETGIKVILDTYDSNETMYAKLMTGNANYDVVVPSSDYVSMMIGQNMLEKIEYGKLPNFKNISSKLLKFINEDGYDKDNRYSVPYFVGSTGININEEFVKESEESWRIFGRSDLKDRMSMMNDPRDVIGIALKTLGFSGNSINLSELEQAKDLILQEWKPNLLKFDSETFGKDFAAGNVWISHGYAEVVLNERERSKENYKFILPKEGTMITLDSMVILKNAKNKDAAYQLINYVLKPAVHARTADMFYYPVIISDAEKYRKDVPAYELDDLLEVGELRKDIGESISLYSDIWDQVFQGY